MDVNQHVAKTYVLAEQVKGLFLASTKLLLILLSGVLMFLGVTSLAMDTFTVASFLTALPFAIASGLLALCVEGGTVFTSAMLQRTKKQIAIDIAAINKAASKLDAKDIAARIKRTHRKAHLPVSMMILCCLFSIAGSELFWHKLLLQQPVFFQVIGYLLGVIVSSLLIIFELNAGTLEQVIEECISNSKLTRIALEESSRSLTYNSFFKARRSFLKTSEVETVLTQAATQSLYGLLADTIIQNGLTVDANQLQLMVQHRIEMKEQAETIIQNAGTVDANVSSNTLVPDTSTSSDTTNTPSQTIEPLTLVRNTPTSARMTPNKQKVLDGVSKFGKQRMLDEPTKYAAIVGVKPATFKRLLEAI